MIYSARGGVESFFFFFFFFLDKSKRAATSASSVVEIVSSSSSDMMLVPCFGGCITLTALELDGIKGQVSGIAFWFKLLNLGWLNFLAAADPATLIGAAPVEDIASFLEPGRIAAAETTPSGRADGDGIVLNEAEVRFLQVLIAQDAREGDEELVAEGLASLKQKGLVSGDEEEGYQITDQLVMAMAITLEPELKLEASPTALAAAEQTLRYYKFGDYLVEQTTPAPGQMRLAGLRDVGHAQERLLQVIPLAESDLGAISLSLTADQFETAVNSAAAGALDPAAGLGLDPAAAGVVADLASALDSGQVVGTIRLRQYDGQTEIKKRELQFVQGGQATWLVSREGEQGRQVGIALASPTTISQQLGLTSAAAS